MIILMHPRHRFAKTRTRRGDAFNEVARRRFRDKRSETRATARLTFWTNLIILAK
jgi:hypothetical protein